MRDAHSFDEFYRQTSTRLMRYGYALAGDAVEAQDLVQEAYAKAWRHWRTVAAHPAPEAWVRLTMSRLATDRFRRLTAWRGVLSRTGPPPPIAPPSENTVLLTAALRKLPAAHRQAVALHYLFDMSVDAIARETGAAEGTVKSWLSRGRAALAAQLSEAHHGRILEGNDV
ncbi:RNA polymerase sigma factor [Krasilnikovia sp. MM14-A1004]|uniref:RNA polymerase sigma factor n=1 Tax=Krasilnikovia sp. MM14-A1004 TaxID=3373541 RepID=UPI00399CA697